MYSFLQLRRLVSISVWSISVTLGFMSLAPALRAQVNFVPTIVRVAGTAPTSTGSVAGSSGNGGLATNAQLNSPDGVAYDRAGNLYIADYNNAVVRKVDTNGIISIFAGGGSGTCSSAIDAVGDGCPAIDVALMGPSRIALDSAGNVYISDYVSSLVRRVSTTGIITTYAGNVSMGPGYNGDNIAATNAQLYEPAGLAFDSTGDLYIADHGSSLVRKVNTSGIITTVAGEIPNSGGAQAGYNGENIPATSALLNEPNDVAVDAAGNLYIADTSNAIVRKVDTTGTIRAFAGTPTVQGFSGDGNLATSAELSFPTGIALDGRGDLFIADSGNYVAREVNFANGLITTVAGNYPNNGFTGDNGVATSARMETPESVVLSGAGDLYISDIYNDVVRKVDLSGITSFLPTSVGKTSASLNVFFQLASGVNPPIAVAANFKDFTAGSPTCSADSMGNLCFVAVTFGPQVPGARSAPLEVSTGSNSFFALTGTGNGPAVALTPGVISTENISGLLQPTAVAADAGGNLYVADASAQTLTKVSSSGTQTLVKSGLSNPQGVAVDAAGNIYVADTSANTVLKIPANGGPAITLVSGLSGPQGVVVDAVGNVYIANTGAASVVEVPANGAAQLNLATGLSNPTGIAVDGSGNVYVVERNGGDVTEIPVAGGARVSLATGLDNPYAIAVDAAGNLYISLNGGSQVVEKVDAGTHGISTVAGSNASGYAGDGGAATSATLNQPLGVAVDGSGNLYIADSSNQVVRKVVVGPSSATLAFMTTNLGATSSDSPQSANVTNIGNQALNFSALSVSANFAIASTTTCSTASPVALGTSCEVGIDFTPTSGGNLSGTATLADNALNEVTPQATQIIPLNGTGAYLAAELAFAPLPAASISAGNSIGTVNVDVDTSGGVIATTSNVPVTLTLTGPSGFTAQTYTANAVNGVATFSLTTPLTVVGSYNLTASSSGLNSATATVTVAMTTPVLTWVPATLSEMYGTALGANVLDATVSGGVQGSIAYTAQLAGGTVQPVNVATVLPAGSYTLVATFTPADTSTYSTATKSVTFTVTNGTLIVSANSATRVYGTANPAFTGSVLGAVHGDTFVETFTTTAQQSSSAGTYPIVPAVAGPDLADYTVTINNGVLTITKAAARLALQASGNSVALGSTVTLTATATSATTGVPTGTVTFYDGANPLGTAALNAQGVASWTVSNIPAGTNVISAVYGGDVNFTGANAQLAQPIQAGVPSFALTANPTSMTTKQGKTANTMLTLTTQYGFNGTVKLSCQNLPAGANCQFGNASIVLNANGQASSTPLSITTWGFAQSSTAASHAPNQPTHPKTGSMDLLTASIFWLPGLLLGGFLSMERKKLRGGMAHVLLLLVAVTGLLGMMSGLTGCANLTPDAAIGSYQIAVVATPANGAPAQSRQLLLTIIK